jgi:hypothetical protein
MAEVACVNATRDAGKASRSVPSRGSRRGKRLRNAALEAGPADPATLSQQPVVVGEFASDLDAGRPATRSRPRLSREAGGRRDGGAMLLLSLFAVLCVAALRSTSHKHVGGVRVQLELLRLLRRRGPPPAAAMATASMACRETPPCLLLLLARQSLAVRRQQGMSIEAFVVAVASPLLARLLLLLARVVQQLAVVAVAMSRRQHSERSLLAQAVCRGECCRSPAASRTPPLLRRGLGLSPRP